MAEKAQGSANPPPLSTSSAKSPDSDVSPGTRVPSKHVDYFGVPNTQNAAAAGSLVRERGPSLDNMALPSGDASTAPSTATTTSLLGQEGANGSRRPSSNGSDRLDTISRKSSSVSFRPPRNPSLPQGFPRKTNNERLRKASPSPKR